MTKNNILKEEKINDGLWLHSEAISENPGRFRNWFKWTEGRQGGGYRLFTFFSIPWINVDLHLIHMSEGSRIPWHKDPCTKPGYEHHRLNISLKQPKIGGRVEIVGSVNFIIMYKERWLLYAFRPDLHSHRVTEATEGERLVLSFGWLKKMKKKKERDDD